MLLLDDGSDRESLLGLSRYDVGPAHYFVAVRVWFMGERYQLE